MATKKECDRCSKHWDQSKWAETCSVAVNAPQWHDGPINLSWEYKKKTEKVYELCQDCTRAVIRMLETKGQPVDKSY